MKSNLLFINKNYLIFECENRVRWKKKYLQVLINQEQERNGNTVYDVTTFNGANKLHVHTDKCFAKKRTEHDFNHRL